ncbi:hypothetical protein Dsin_027682 [Dipteronia sinensis]|uniref:Uncharacterized protein n=1 Tax=Dipteronia sinensis TaxID=43782 RepID=A0AAD9ZQU4_9ROSI|nr:hypothetical protein Dsin_027682 [Dipteronia sinensis]
MSFMIRGEAQRHLDEMNCALGSASNSNLQVNYPLYSHESSVQSSTKPSMKNQGALSVGGHWQSSYPPKLNFVYQRPNKPGELSISTSWVILRYREDGFLMELV